MFHPDQTAKLQATPAGDHDLTATEPVETPARAPPRDADAAPRNSSRTQPLRALPRQRDGVGWAVGDVLADRYYLERELGGGAMGEVFLARDRLLRKNVALKLLKPALTRNRETVRRFLREVALAHSVTHPNVVRIYDTGEAEGLPYLSMEYLQGQTLDALVDREDGAPPMTFREIRDLSLEILAGLEAAHEAGVIHRDLKPANVMLTHRGAIVMDFGVAGLDTLPSVAPDPGHATSLIRTEAGTIFGSPAYMAPELWEGAPATVQSDLYSFGVMLYQLITAKLPYEAKTAMEFLEKLRAGRYPPVRALRRDCPRNLATLVARCMTQEPDGRPLSARQAAAMIAPLTTRAVRRRALGAAAVLGLVGIASSAAFRGDGRARQMGVPDDVAVADLDSAVRAWDVGDHAASLRTLERLQVRAPSSAAVVFWLAVVDHELADESSRVAHCAKAGTGPFAGSDQWQALADEACGASFQLPGSLEEGVMTGSTLADASFALTVEHSIIPRAALSRDGSAEVFAVAATAYRQSLEASGASGDVSAPVRRRLAGIEVLLAQGRFDQAQSELEDARSAHPEAPIVHARAAGLYALRGDLERARALAEQIESIDPRVAFRLMMQEGRMREAWRRIGQRTLNTPDDPHIEALITMWCGYALRFEVTSLPAQCRDLGPGLVRALWAWPSVNARDLDVMSAQERELYRHQQQISLGECSGRALVPPVFITQAIAPFETYSTQLHVSDALCASKPSQADVMRARELADALLLVTPADPWLVLLRARVDQALGALNMALARQRGVADFWFRADDNLPLVRRLREIVGDSSVRDGAATDEVGSPSKRDEVTPSTPVVPNPQPVHKASDVAPGSSGGGRASGGDSVSGTPSALSVQAEGDSLSPPKGTGGVTEPT